MLVMQAAWSMNDCSLELVQSVLDARSDVNPKQRRRLLAETEEIFDAILSSREEEASSGLGHEYAGAGRGGADKAGDDARQSMKVMQGTFSSVRRLGDDAVEEVDDGKDGR